MHAHEVDTDVELVQRLVRGRFPQWADLPVERLASGGTVNAVYRLGDALTVRLPLTAGGVTDLEREGLWARGRGWALSMAVVQLPYYRNTNPIISANARHVIREVLAPREFGVARAEAAQQG